MQKAIAEPNRKQPPDRAGARAFRQLRLTGIALIVLVVYALLLVLRIAGADAAEARHALSRPWIGLPVLALILVGAWHMRLGMREILEDYLRKPGLTFWLAVNTVFGFLVAVLAAGSVLRLWIGG
jgi:succinate dehydrogenase / fumarate reductase membrane anchor subunit